MTIRFMKEKYSPLLLSTRGKAIVLLGAVGLLIAGIYGVTQVSESTPRQCALAHDDPSCYRQLVDSFRPASGVRLCCSP